MKIEKLTPSMTHDALHCASTGETIPFDLYKEIIESAEAIIAFWFGGNGVDYPIIKDKNLADAWNEIFQPWIEADEVELDFFDMLESFLDAYENPHWKVMQCTFTFACCTGQVKDTMYIVAKNDAEIVKAETGDKENDTEVSAQEEPESKIEVIETDYPINCPFCDELIRNDDEEGDCFYDGGNCEHLLFEATDYGFEQISQKFIENMGIQEEELNSPGGFHPKEEDIDEFTSRTTIPDSVKYAVYHGMSGSLLGAYFGFAP